SATNPSDKQSLDGQIDRAEPISDKETPSKPANAQPMDKDAAGQNEAAPPEKPAGGAPSFKDILGSRYERLMKQARKLRAVPEMAAILDGVTDEQIAAMIGYTMEDYKLLNAALRSRDPIKLQALAPYIERARDGLQALPSYQGTVFRGIPDLP